MSRRVFALLVCAVAAGCGGSTSTPLAPAATQTTNSAVTTASINGAVQTPAGTAAGMTVDVIGTTLRATVGSDNRFGFPAVPAGQHRLRFSGGGANAEVALDPVSSGESLDVVVAVSGATASIQSGHKLGVNETRFEARITSIDAAAGSLVAADKTVTTTTATVIKNGSQTIPLSALTATTLIEVTGTQGTTSFAARLIDVLRDPQLQINGTVAALTGNASAFEFTLGARRITGTGATEFRGGPNPSFARLANGVSVHVTAADKGTHAEATRIIVQEDETATPGSVTGLLASVMGTSPSLTLQVAGNTVRTNAATLVRRGSTVLPLSALALGQTLAVDGTLGTDGSITAAKIQIEELAASITGTLTAITGTSPTLTLTVGGASVVTNADTIVRRGTSVVTLATLATGQSLVVDGTSAGGIITAAQIQIQQTTVTVTGELSAITGTTPVFTLTVGASTVRTSAATTVRRSATVLTLAALTTGQILTIEGASGTGGVIDAQGIAIAETPTPSAVTVSGTLSSVTGTSPALTLTVGGTTVTTTSTTDVRQGTTDKTLADLTTGQSLVVEGTAGTGGIVTATSIAIALETSPMESFDSEGIVSAVAGTCPAVSFKLSGRTVTANGSTHFVQLTCGTLVNGMTVRVRGTQLGDGSVVASQVKKSK